MNRDRAGAVGFWLLLALLLIGLSVFGGGGPNQRPLDPRSVSPDGAKALVDLLGEVGADVRLGDDQPDDSTDVALLLLDRYGTDGSATLSSWVRSGGRLVVADPFSTLAPDSLPTFEQTLTGPDCSVEALADVTTISSIDSRFDVDDVAGGVACFDGAVVVEVIGDGFVISVGGPGPFLNRNLAFDDNAVLAVALLAPTDDTRVSFLEPRFVSGVEEESISDLVRDPVWVLLFQSGVAFLIFAWFKARRLGAPVAEPVDVRIEGAELAAARGRLLEGLRQPEAAAGDVRWATRNVLRRRLGLPADVSNEVLADAVARHASVDAAEVRALLADRPVADDAALHGVAQGLGRLRAEVLGTASAGIAAEPTAPRDDAPVLARAEGADAHRDDPSTPTGAPGD